MVFLIMKASDSAEDFYVSPFSLSGAGSVTLETDISNGSKSMMMTTMAQ